MIEPFGVRAIVGDGPLDMHLSRGLKSWPIYDAGGGLIAKVHGLLLEDWLGDGLSLQGSEIRVATRVETPLAFARDVVERLAAHWSWKPWAGRWGGVCTPIAGLPFRSFSAPKSGGSAVRRRNCSTMRNIMIACCTTV